MVSVKDKIEAEEHNGRAVRLWPEGTNYKAYERSAYLMGMLASDLEPRRQYMQAVGSDVVTIEFPQSVLEKLYVSRAPATDGAEVIQLPIVVDEQIFQLWREAISLCFE